MKRFFYIAFWAMVTAVSATAQQFTLEDIYKNYTYYHYPFFDACQIYGNTIYCGEYTIAFESEDLKFNASLVKEIPNIPKNSDILANKQGTKLLYSEDKKSFRRNSTIGSYMYYEMFENADSTLPKPDRKSVV